VRKRPEYFSNKVSIFSERPFGRYDETILFSLLKFLEIDYLFPYDIVRWPCVLFRIQATAYVIDFFLEN
jgi:hypothetical protein